MISPRRFQLEHLALLALPDGADRQVLKADDLRAVELAMRHGDPLDTSACTPTRVSRSALIGAATIIHTDLLGPYSARLALLVVHWVLTRNGYRYVGDAEDLTAICSQVVEVTRPPLYLPDAQSVERLSQWVRFQPESPSGWRGRGMRAYVISALTGLDEARHAAVLDQSDEVAFVLEELGFWTHLPARYTNPNTDPNHPIDEVRRLDYGLVINADLCVFIAAAPTTGGGEELAWADAAGTPVIAVTDELESISKLVRGTTGKLVDVDPVHIESGLRAAIAQLRPDVRARRNVRDIHVEKYGGLAQEIRGLARSGEIAQSPLLTDRRIDELCATAEHLAQAPSWQLEEVSRLLGTHYGPVRALDADETDALVEYGNSAGLSVEALLRLAQRGQRLVGAQSRIEDNRLDTDMWRRLDRGDE